MLDHFPELHRDTDRQDRDERAGERGREEPWCEVVEERRHWDRERGEVRPTASREPARSRHVRPRGCERAGLGRCDCAVLGAVQAQRAAAEEPEDDRGRREDPSRELESARERDERERKQQRAEQKQPFAKPGNAAAAHEGRHRGRQLEQAADERNPGRPRPAHRHRALVQLACRGSERPEALADDHDAVGPGHAAELRQHGGCVGAGEQIGDGRVHPPRVAQKRPPGECRTA